MGSDPFKPGYRSFDFGSKSWGLDFGVLILGPNRMAEFC